MLLNDATALRHPLQQALPKPLASSGCTKAMVIFALELAFGVFDLAEAVALYQALPEDADLNALSPDAMDLAFRGQSAQAIAAALQALAARKEDLGGAGLEALAGMGELSMVAATLVADLADYKAGELPWSEMPRGILLHGGPGTGKTYAAGCIARASQLPLIAATVGGWQAAGHLGDMLKAMNASFNEARSKAPCILFIDELDSLGSRQSKDNHGSSYRTQVINEMLAQMDGIAGLEGVFLIGATNHPEAIDPAIQRPGRLDHHIAVPMPGRQAIEAQLLRHLGPDAAQVDLPAVMRLTRGKTPAELAAAIRYGRSQARRAKRPLCAKDILGYLQPAPLNIEREWMISLHEAGHALVGHLLAIGRPTELCIDQDGGEAHMRLYPSKGSLEYVENRIAYILAGRAAELIQTGRATAGAGGDEDSDLARATELAISIERSLGLGQNGLIWEQPPSLLGRALSAEERALIAKRLNAAEARAKAILIQHKESLLDLAEALCTTRHLQEEEILPFLPDALEMAKTVPLKPIPQNNTTAPTNLAP